MSPINLKFLRHSDFEYSRIRETGGGCRRTGCDTSSLQYKYTLAARRRSNNTRSLLVLRAMQRQRRAIYNCYFGDSWT